LTNVFRDRQYIVGLNFKISLWHRKCCWETSRRPMYCFNSQYHSIATNRRIH